MQTNTQTATVSKVDLTHRFTGIITYGNGKDVFLDVFYKTEKAARNAAIRARARLLAAGETVLSIRTATLVITFTGSSSPIKRGIYPSDYNARDHWMENYF